MIGRITWLFAGLLIGGVSTLVSMKYHVVRAEDGVHLVPKATAELTLPYVDIRKFEPADWSERRDLALAIVQADKSQLLEDSAVTGLQQTMERVLNTMRPSEVERR